jgi:type IV pilus assembly protein PilQ
MSRKDCIRLAFSVIIVLSTAVWVSAASDNERAGNNVVLSNMEQRLQKKISVDFRDTPIDDVIKTLAEQANIDVIKSPDVTGTVTAKLTNVPLKEALDNILAAQGYGYVVSENVIRIAPIAKLEKKEEPMVSRVYTITYADVKEVEAALNKFKSDKGTIASNPGTSNLLVTDYESKIKAIDLFVDQIDRVTPQILVEARIYDVTTKDRLDLGVQWEGGRRTNYAGVGVTDVGPNPTGNVKPFTTGVFNGTVNKTLDTTGGLRLGFLTNDVDIDMLIRAQAETISSNLLASPRILVLDNKTAEIKIVQQIPFQQLNQGGGTTLPFGTIEFKEVGVTLNVTPHLTREGLIRMQLKPSFSVQSGTANVLPPSQASFPVPVIDKRDADTTLLVKDGTTVVLGGLRRKDISKQVNKVPFLGDIPVIGNLFKFNSDETVNNELLVFITPRIITTEGLTEQETKHYNTTEFVGPTPLEQKAEVPGNK